MKTKTNTEEVRKKIIGKADVELMDTTVTLRLEPVLKRGEYELSLATDEPYIKIKFGLDHGRLKILGDEIQRLLAKEKLTSPGKWISVDK